MVFLALPPVTAERYQSDTGHSVGVNPVLPVLSCGRPESHSFQYMVYFVELFTDGFHYLSVFITGL